MNFNMKIQTIALTSAFLFSAGSAFAADQDSLVSQQKSMLETLDSLNDAVLGLRVNGTAKAGLNTSIASSDNIADNSPTQENQAFTDVDLRFGANPSAETHIDVRVRLHKDWQSSYDENNNPIIGHWFSYDGSILNNHLDFNLGYMRVGYTPLTISTPRPELLQEPEIFAARRVEALDRRNLDTTDRRLMHGLNAVYQSGSIGAVDNVTMQLTGARIRNTAKKGDQVFFDFDFSDRYLFGARLGIDLFGIHLGGDLVNLSDRKLSARTHAIATGDTVIYDYNRVYAGELGFDSKKFLPSLPVSFGFNGEFAMSAWEADFDYMGKSTKDEYVQGEGFGIINLLGEEDSLLYVKKITKSTDVRLNDDLDDNTGKSFYVEPFVKGDIANVDFSVKVGYMQTDENFWSEMASTPNYQGGSIILNANAIYSTPVDSLIMATFGSASLENLYFNVYNTKNLEATDLMTSNTSNVLSAKDENVKYMYSRLDNNYKVGHFYRNAYTATVLKHQEVAADMFLLDPTVSLALPFGMATPDRKGVIAKGDLNWNDAVTFNVRVEMLNQANLVVGYEIDQANSVVDQVSEGLTDTHYAYKEIVDENKFMRYAAGLGVDFGRILGLDRKLLIQGSYDHAEEDKYLKRKSDRIMAGGTFDVWGPIGVLAGYQSFKKEFGETVPVGTVAVTEVAESLILGGVRVKIAPLSYVSLQGGLLMNEIKYNTVNAAGEPTTGSLSIDKTVLAADVTVNF